METLTHLREIRERRGIPAAALAKHVGVTRQTIYAIEAGDYVPNTTVALQLARILEVSVGELFSLEPESAVDLFDQTTLYQPRDDGFGKRTPGRACEAR